MRILAALALLLLAPASCKKYDKSDDPDLAGTTSGGDTEKKPPPVKPMPPPPKKVLKPEELGSCKLTASGAVAKEQTSVGGREATNVTYWMKKEESQNLAGSDGFVVHCNGPDIKFSITPTGKPDSMPFKPKKYAISKNTGDAGVSVRFGKASLDNVGGTIDVTAFDAHHIAGTIDLKGKLTPGNGEVKLTGSFDLICPNLSACAP